jgi:hypothetical protein
VLKLIDQLDLVAVRVEAALLEVEPIVEPRMRAAGTDLLFVKIVDAIDARVGPHAQFRMDVIDALPEVDPVVAARAMSIGGDVIAADELDLAGGDLLVGVAGRNAAIVSHFEPVPFPRARFGNDVQERKV